MLQVASYFRREIYTVCYLLLAAWPFIYGIEFVKANGVLIFQWALACICMSRFTLLDALKIEDTNTM